MSKIKLNLCWNFGFSKCRELVKAVANCYLWKNCFWVCFFSEFSLFWCNKVIFVLMFGTQYYFCSMFCAENWIVVRAKLTKRFLWRGNFAIDCAVKMLLWECTWCFLYILVFAFYVFKTVKVSVTAERNWGDVNLFKPCRFLAYVKKNV